MASQFDNFLNAIGYPPEQVRMDGGAIVLRVDDRDVRVSLSGARLVFLQELCHPAADDGILEAMSSYAAGRLLKEEATLAWDEVTQSIVLWQETPADGAPKAIRRVFELFLTSCDWWQARIEDEAAPAFPTMAIMP